MTVGERIRVAVLGSTGSIGESTLRVVERHADRFQITVLAANRSVDPLEAQAARHSPARVVVADEEAWGRCRDRGAGWVGGRDALLEVISRDDVDVVVNALVGFAGLEPSLRTLDAGKRLALANKESLVAGGPLVMEALERGGGELVPIDSEHSAILQCLEGRPPGTVERVVLTASGGPFREWAPERLARATPADALQHPTWEMGAKITVDSATLANKALEVMEAHFLYGLGYERIDAVVHPQSIIHSFVEFVDGSVLAQLGFPNMELPILYALTYPERVSDRELRTFDPVRSSPLTFESLDMEAFPMFALGVAAGRAGGRGPIGFNAANEVAVAAFLNGRLSLPDMARIVEGTLEGLGSDPIESIDDVFAADREARRIADEITSRHAPPGAGATE